MVPHMNELSEKFESRGLTIVGVTDESEKDTVKWIKRNGAKYAYAYDKGGAMARTFGVRGIPDAVLVDSYGTIVWRGHPGKLDEKTIEEALKGAVQNPMWKWPSEADGVRKALLKDKYASALEAAAKAGDDYEKAVRERIAHVVSSAKDAHQAGDYLRAATLSERAQKALAGLPEADEMAALLAGIKKDPQAQKILRVQEDLAELEMEAMNVSSDKQARVLAEKLEKLATDHPGTIVQERAERTALDLRRMKFR